jgi:hypothetical protein
MVMNKFLTFLLSSALCFLVVTSAVSAKGLYQTQEQFIGHALKSDIPKAKVIWLSADDKKVIADILNHQFNRLRLRYWQNNNETVWVLDEIGKEKPITIGVHIKDQHIVELKVLAFRESRGDEVRHDFFTKQFNLAKLTNDNKLSTHIDGITGATLSVRALTKVARLALWLNAKAKATA